jgi:hypothetical protein
MQDSLWGTGNGESRRNAAHYRNGDTNGRSRVSPRDATAIAVVVSCLSGVSCGGVPIRHEAGSLGGKTAKIVNIVTILPI